VRGQEQQLAQWQAEGQRVRELEGQLCCCVLLG